MPARRSSPHIAMQPCIVGCKQCISYQLGQCRCYNGNFILVNLVATCTTVSSGISRSAAAVSQLCFHLVAFSAGRADRGRTELVYQSSNRINAVCYTNPLPGSFWSKEQLFQKRFNFLLELVIDWGRLGPARHWDAFFIHNEFLEVPCNI